ncbi:hypothetical protein FNV65_54735 [Streptomyces sp. S1A1-8]|nr:hypothetical protein FNV58_00040 [Streptomyces sp. RLB1-9]QDO26791.1 hypothetical protein FNV65_54735 [Streptomyces sp. S1A1-8]QDO36904.1 hypothetical protein FNV63_54755 [Streptomyces sp. S1A1-3]
MGWLLEPYVVDCVTLARGVEPVDLASRLGARSGQEPRLSSAEEAVDLLTDPGIDGVARVGRAGDWAFAVEYGDAAGCTEAGLRAVSRDGAEAINFLMTPWNPPSMFAYYKDGIHICSFGIGEETRRWGRESDLLVPALEKVGVLPGRQACDADRHRGQRLSMMAIEEHFGLRLRKRDIVGRLPLFRVRQR